MTISVKWDHQDGPTLNNSEWHFFWFITVTNLHKTSSSKIQMWRCLSSGVAHNETSHPAGPGSPTGTNGAWLYHCFWTIKSLHNSHLTGIQSRCLNFIFFDKFWNIVYKNMNRKISSINDTWHIKHRIGIKCYVCGAVSIWLISIYCDIFHIHIIS